MMAAIHAPISPKATGRYSTAESALVDRRRAIRVPHRARFVIRPLLSNGVGAEVTVILQDLSATGMGVLHSAPLRVGEQYQVPLTCEIAASAGLSLVCTVARCEQMDDELYTIGFQFNSSAAAIDAGSRQLTGQPAPPAGDQ
jgi:hypothetical protein